MNKQDKYRLGYLEAEKVMVVKAIMKGESVKQIDILMNVMNEKYHEQATWRLIENE